MVAEKLINPEIKYPTAETPEPVSPAGGFKIPEQTPLEAPEQTQIAEHTPEIQPEGTLETANTAKDIEKILEGGLGDIYNQIPAHEQPQFAAQGEQTATEILELLNTGKATEKAINQKVLTWLKTIPNANKNFIEQEAFRKTQNIMQQFESLQ